VVVALGKTGDKVSKFSFTWHAFKCSWQVRENSPGFSVMKRKNIFLMVLLQNQCQFYWLILIFRYSFKWCIDEGPWLRDVLGSNQGPLTRPLPPCYRMATSQRTLRLNPVQNCHLDKVYGYFYLSSIPIESASLFHSFSDINISVWHQTNQGLHASTD